MKPLAGSQGYGFADSPEHAEDSVAFGGLPALKHRCRSGESHLHPMRQLVADVLEECVNDRELAAPEVFPVAAEIGEQRVGLLDKGRENPLLNLGALGGVDDAITHVDKDPEVVLGCFRPHEAARPLESS